MKAMKNYIVAALVSIGLMSGCIGREDPSKTVSPEKTFDYVTYNSWSELADETYDFRAMTWEESEGEIAPNCLLDLPSVIISHHRGDCYSKEGDCYSKEAREIVVFTQRADTCEEQVDVLYHQFTHFLNHCNYGTVHHSEDVFEKEEYESDVDNLQEHLCD